jgi:DNA polymerase III sliding clamp (beta) subunit (PCNA family)
MATDSELVARARLGEERAFAVLVERYRRLLVRLARRLLSRADDADDVAQRVVLRTEGEILTVTAQAGELGSAYEELEVAREGDDIETALSFRYLLDVLAALDSEGCYLETTRQPNAAVVIRPVEDEDHSVVIMPMRLS